MCACIYIYKLKGGMEEIRFYIREIEAYNDKKEEKKKEMM